MMDVWTCVAFILMALIAGISITSALFCMRERNSERAKYNKLYEKWSMDNDYIIDIERENVEKTAEIKYWKEKYETVVPPTPCVIEAPVPEV